MTVQNGRFQEEIVLFSYEWNSCVPNSRQAEDRCCRLSSRGTPRQSDPPASVDEAAIGEYLILRETVGGDIKSGDFLKIHPISRLV